MCHHRGDIPGEMPEWTNERADSDAEAADDEDDLPEFLNEEGEDVSVLTDGGGED